MANFNLNIAKQVYENTFGYFQIPKLLDLDPRLEKETNRFGTEYNKKDEYGNDMFSPVTLRIGNSDNAITKTLPYSTVALTATKHIVNTPLVNRKGSVNEQININDYELTIRGVVVSRQEKLPEDWLDNFRLIFTTSLPIEIINPITDFYIGEAERDENQNIIILNHNLPDMRGIDYAQAYSFKARTDTNLKLII